MERTNIELSFFQITLMVLSVLSVFIILIDFTVSLNPEISKVVQISDFVICILFLYDFLYRFIKADSKLAFMKWGWIDLISSIPAIDILRTGRLIRVIKLLKLLRLFRLSKILSSLIIRHRKKNAALAACLISLLLIFSSSVGILITEGGSPVSNIRTAGDAIWWAFVTMTTVGYGDYYPVTLEGRIIASILMVAGVGLFGMFTGMIAAWFMEEK